MSPTGWSTKGDLEAIEVVSPPRVDTLVGYVVPHTFFEKSRKVESPSPEEGVIPEHFGK